MITVDSIVMEIKGVLTRKELDMYEAKQLISCWGDAWETLVELFNQTPRNSKKMRQRRHAQLAWISWHGISTTKKKQRQESPRQKRRRKL